MAFTVRDYQDLLTLLDNHPEWRAELRRAILSDDFLSLPEFVRELAVAQKRTEEQVRELAAAQKRTEEQVRELAAAQKRTEEQIRELAAAQKRTEERLNALSERVEELAAAQKRTEQRVEELAAAQKRTEQRVEELAAAQKNTSVELGRLSAMLGVSLEDEAGNVLATVMRQKGYRVLQEPMSLRFNGEVDVVLLVEAASGRRLWILMESKARLSRSDVIKWSQRLQSPEWRQAIEQAGCYPPFLAYLYAIRVDLSAREAAQEKRIGLIRGHGEEIAPGGEIG